MPGSAIDQSQIRYARLAGIMFLLVDAAYALGLLITSRFQVPGNFAETARKIMASEHVYRMGLASELIGVLCTVLLAMGRYVAVKPINKNLALLALLLRMIEATVFGVMVVLVFGAAKLYAGSDSSKAFDANQLSIVMNLIRSVAGSAGFNIAAIFFSLGSTLFFYLFFKSTYIPKFFSRLGLFGSILVPIVCFGTLIFPQQGAVLQFGWLPIGIAEILAGFWLLFKGINLQHQQTRVATVVST